MSQAFRRLLDQSARGEGRKRRIAPDRGRGSAAVISSNGESWGRKETTTQFIAVMDGTITALISELLPTPD
jgi:hypothetical protein